MYAGVPAEPTKDNRRVLSNIQNAHTDAVFRAAKMKRNWPGGIPRE
jgi:hypothetical protein